MKTSERMAEIAAKLNELVAKDAEKKTFGARRGHEYQMNPPLPMSELQAFERQFGMKLPQDYADFLTQLGNGGIGPGYGLLSLAEAVKDPEQRCREFLATPFPHTEYFNPYDVDEATPDNECFFDQHICGSIALSHHGCGYFDRLVITGPQAGQVWIDSRVSDQGIEPTGRDFFEWYYGWLSDALGNLWKTR
jgi:hypothetical protein